MKTTKQASLELLGKEPERLSQKEFIKFLEAYPCGDMMFNFSRYVLRSMGTEGEIIAFYNPTWDRIDGRVSSQSVIMSPNLKKEIEATGSKFSD